ncbi:MAG: hypothetical protein CMA31_00825 [Euryarchaeota archaeon]|nr:hypothetical protein [Euryarchaeota archaeon]|tara:strand:- start:364 stop:1125 length:762 start_codon:yes stop_codon:yes gene_type:complete
MRFNQFERDALISFGKKHGYITEDMSQEQIDEVLPAVAAAGRMAAKGVGAAAKGAGKLAKAGVQAAKPLVQKGVKAAGQAVQKGAKAVGQAVDKAGGVAGIAQKAGAAVGQGVDKVKAVGQQAAKGFANQQAQGQEPAQLVPPGADQTPSPTGQAPAQEVPPGQAPQPDQKATQKVAQRATALKSIAGGKASGSMVAKGMDKVAQGGTLPPNLIKAIQPYTQSIQTIMQDPQLFSKFKLLMKQAKDGQAPAQQ